MREAGATEEDIMSGWLSLSRPTSPLGLFQDPQVQDNSGTAPETTQTAAAGDQHCENNEQADEVILMLDRSYKANKVQEWIFGQHQKYRSSCEELDVYGSNLSYLQNSARKLTTSDELPQKAYMVDTTPKGAMSPKLQ